jgi:large subunit ribosomal protein L15
VEQHELRPPRGAKKPRKRIGRGNASGHGTYSGRGIKGQQARAGSHVRPGFEGGQTPLIRRLPRRRGFHNPFRVSYTPVNLSDLSTFSAGSEVTPESLREARIVRSLRSPIKILGDGELSTALTVRAHRVSSAARAKIESAGGTVEELTPRPSQPEDKQHPRRAKKAKTAVPKAENEAPSTPETDQEGTNDSGSETNQTDTAD